MVLPEFKTEFELKEMKELNNYLSNVIYRRESETEATAREKFFLDQGAVRLISAFTTPIKKRRLHRK